MKLKDKINIILPDSNFVVEITEIRISNEELTVIGKGDNSVAVIKVNSMFTGEVHN